MYASSQSVPTLKSLNALSATAAKPSAIVSTDAPQSSRSTALVAAPPGPTSLGEPGIQSFRRSQPITWNGRLQAWAELTSPHDPPASCGNLGRIDSLRLPCGVVHTIAARDVSKITECCRIRSGYPAFREYSDSL